MTRSRLRRALAGVALMALLAVGSCAPGPSRPHEALGAGAEPLRAQFNRDAAHTRIVILAAPT